MMLVTSKRRLTLSLSFVFEPKNKKTTKSSLLCNLGKNLGEIGVCECELEFLSLYFYVRNHCSVLSSIRRRCSFLKYRREPEQISILK